MWEQAGIADFALKEEVLLIGHEAPTNGQGVLVPPGLFPFVSESLVEVMYPDNPNEEAAFMGLSALVYDGGWAQMSWFLTMDTPSQPKA